MLTLTPIAIEKVKAILLERGEDAGLRIAVTGGGCSGFQYQMSLDQSPNADDKVIEQIEITFNLRRKQSDKDIDAHQFVFSPGNIAAQKAGPGKEARAQIDRPVDRGLQ